MSTRRLYETTFIVNAALEDQDIDSVVSKVTTYIENHGGELVEINRWGRRRLAYPINKKYNGYYIHLVFNAGPSNLPIIERFMVLEDTILRHLTLTLTETLRQQRLERAQAEGKGTGNYLTSGTDEVKKEAKEGGKDFREGRENRERAPREVQA